MGVARKAGLLASFLPKLAPDEAGSGAHCHISLHNVRILHSYQNVSGLAGQSGGHSGSQSGGASNVEMHMMAVLFLFVLI